MRRLRRKLWRRTYEGTTYTGSFKHRSPFDWREFAGLPQRRTNSPTLY